MKCTYTLYANVYYYRATQLCYLGFGSRNSVRLSVRLSHACFVTNPKNLPAIFLYHILITGNMQSKTGFPSSHRLKSYVAPKSRLKFEARCPVSGCWPSCLTLQVTRLRCINESVPISIWCGCGMSSSECYLLITDLNILLLASPFIVSCFSVSEYKAR